MDDKLVGGFKNDSGYNANNSGYIWVIWWDKLSSGWWLVLAILNNMNVNGKDYIPYMKWKIKVMFQTTNQWKICPLNVVSLLTLSWFIAPVTRIHVRMYQDTLWSFNIAMENDHL